MPLLSRYSFASLTSVVHKPSFLTVAILQGYMARYTKQSAVEAMQAYWDIAQKYGVSPTELALAWCQGQSWTTCSIIGATSMKQLKASICLCQPFWLHQAASTRGQANTIRSI